MPINPLGPQPQPLAVDTTTRPTPSTPLREIAIGYDNTYSFDGFTPHPLPPYGSYFSPPPQPPLALLNQLLLLLVQMMLQLVRNAPQTQVTEGAVVSYMQRYGDQLPELPGPPDLRGFRKVVIPAPRFSADLPPVEAWYDDAGQVYKSETNGFGFRPARTFWWGPGQL